MQDASESPKLRQKRLARERQTHFKKRQKINHKRIINERQKKSAKKKLVKERQAYLIRRKNIKNNNYPPKTQIPSGQELNEFELCQKTLARERQA